MKNRPEAPQKTVTTVWSSHSTSENVSEGHENTNSKGYKHHVPCRPSYRNNLSVHLKTNGLKKIGKGTAEYYLAIKKNEILPLVTTWIDLESILLNEINQSKTSIIRSHSCVESKKKPKQNKFENTEGRLVVARGRGVKDGTKWVKEVKGPVTNVQLQSKSWGCGEFPSWCSG